MGATYTRQSTYTDGDVIQAADTNDEFNQLLAAFQASTGHTHDGTANEGGPITKMLGTSLTLGDGTAGTDITVTFDGESNDGVLAWMEDEDYFKFSDDILINGTEKLYFQDTGTHIFSNADGDLDLVSDGTNVDAIKLASAGGITLDAAGDIVLDADGDDITLKNGSATFASFTNSSGELVIKSGSTPTTAMTFSGANVTFAGTVTIGSAGISEAELEILDGATVTTDELNILDGVTATTAEINLIDGDTSATSTTVADADRVVYNDAGTMKQVAVTDLDTYFSATTKTLTNKTLTTPVIAEIDNSGDITLDAGTDIILDADGGDIFFKDAGTTFGSATNTSGNLIIKSGTTTALTFSGADVTIAGDLTISGDDLTMGTNTSGHIMVADGTNFNPVAVSGDVTISNTGAVTIANDAVETAMLNDNFITGQTAETSIASNDVLLIYDTSASAVRKITRANFTAGLASSDAINTIVQDTSPQLGGNLDTNSHNILIDDAHFIADENGNEQIIFQTTSSAVNQFDITNAATGNSPEISATGDDTNISLKITPKGSGQVLLDGNVGVESGVIDLKNSGSQSYIRFYCESSNAHYTQIQAAAHSAYSGNATVTLPTSTDTLVGRATTDTLTNKTLTTPTLTTPIANAGVQLKNGSTSAGFLEFFEDSDNGTNKVTLIGPSSTSDITLTLPSSAGTVATTATAADEATALAIALG